ncbi:selenium cofactor biosynthesis protein YqeC [Microaceticoccus formicicus]|uniref:selenium cofactor biosynthesis protein YqeC n=1 Tax=Microaceticoccus formicicus TaxID=3118105 RepID=UPI003CD035A9|nr:selenium cofactor biosynthesis protein YqeC [Peptoniphilaceae bacterium AMB_02]
MNLTEAFDIKKHDIVAFVGSGGKTTAMYTLAEELMENGSVLVTTTTKIGIPKNQSELKMYYPMDKIAEIDNKRFRLIVTGGREEKNKITSITDEDFKAVYKKFDYILIESDGSKMLPYKAWREFEPVIREETTKTIGIIPINGILEKIGRDRIFNDELFVENFGFKDILTMDVLLNILKSKSGIFKGAKGKKYLYFNHCTTENDVLKAKMIIDELSKLDLDIEYVYGSTLKGYNLYKK